MCFESNVTQPYIFSVVVELTINKNYDNYVILNIVPLIILCTAVIQ